ncbi:MAG: 4-alpha-glucanotransferase [Deltaproteobacteria bacterium]
MKLQRGSGILLHLSSLPGPDGIGDLGASAFRFVDFLKRSGQRYWQFLPLGPCSRSFGMSPYMSLSAFAGNPLFIDLRQLHRQGLLEGAPESAGFSEHLIDFNAVMAHKHQHLEQAFQVFQKSPPSPDFEKFCQKEEYWLSSYSLFMALREKFGERPWATWPRDIATMRSEALRGARKELSLRIRYHQFLQYCFFDQWRKLKSYANENGIRLIGDLPIYVGLGSADVWANQQNYLLDPVQLTPTKVAGVPPDYFSETGQRWGNPIYRWRTGNGINTSLYQWWQLRFAANYRTADIVRIDHFRGFESFWQIPASEETAVSGEWAEGPGIGFFQEMCKSIDTLPIIAEDLGIITPAVEELRDRLQYPGMKVLQFAFDSDESNAYLPHNYTTTNCLVYTGTHDNDTAVGWYLSPKVPESCKARLRRYANSDGRQINWDFIRLALSSVAAAAIIPMQDILGFGSDCRMNMPSTIKGNWRWRCAEQHLNDAIADRLFSETSFYGRLPQQHPPEAGEKEDEGCQLAVESVAEKKCRSVDNQS